MKKFLLLIAALFCAACASTVASPPASAQPCQWNYTFVANVATAVYCGNVISSGGANITSLASVAALEAIPAPTVAQTFNTLSYNVGKNLGGGFWYFDITSSTNDPCGITGGVAASDGTTGRWRRIPPVEKLTASMCGAYGDGTHDDAAALQAGLNTGANLYLDCDNNHSYLLVANALRFQRNSQIFEGCGNAIYPALGRSIITSSTSGLGRLISFSVSPGNPGVTSAQLRDMDVECNSILATGVEVYDNSVNTGSGNGHNELDHVSVRDCTSVGVELGHSQSAPRFANDFRGFDVVSQNNARGFWLNGSTENCFNCTIYENTTAGVRMETGGEWNCHSCISYGNNAYIQAANPFNITLVGGTSQQETSGIIEIDDGPAAGGSITVTGMYLNVANTASEMFNFKAAAGSIALTGDFAVSQGGSSTAVNGCNPTFSMDFGGSQGFTYGGTCTTYTDTNVPAGSAVSLTNATPLTLVGLTLQPGTWDVQGTVVFAPAGSTNTTLTFAGLNSAGNAIPTAPNNGGYVSSVPASVAGHAPSLTTGITRYVLASTTTIYLNAEAFFNSGTEAMYGYMRAQRPSTSVAN